MLVVALVPAHVARGAAAAGTLHLDGLMVLRGQGNGVVRVVITALDAPARTVEHMGGHFNLDLGLGRQYLLGFEMQGYVTKVVYFDTQVPHEQQGRAFDFPFQVTLVEKGSSGVLAYDGPVGFVHYAPEARDFIHHTDYRAITGSSEEERIRQLVDRHNEALVAAPAARPASRAAPIFKLHERRDGLYTARARDVQGRLLAEGTFTDVGLKDRHGEFVYYHLNGNVESRGRFEHGRKVGLWQRFDAQGRPMAERMYDPAALDAVDGSKAGMLGQPALPIQAADVSHTAVGSWLPVVGGRSAPLAGGHDAADACAPLAVVEELIVERHRVITVVRMGDPRGGMVEYRRVADRHGSVLYFRDGRSISHSTYHLATGR